MGLKWRSLLFYAGIALLLEASICSAGARVPRTSAKTLAQRTGATHYEERFEKVSSSEENHEHQLRKRASDEDFDYEVYQGVVGRPGIDFPILPRIPQTTFSCRTFGNGYFADLESECQVFHICDDGRKISFLCPNGTIFQQSELICDWWFKVNCPASPGHYAESAEMLTRAQGRKNRPTYTKKVDNEFHPNGDGYIRNPISDKNQYPIKKDNRRFEVSTGRKKDRKYESDEVRSLENFDFEDISDNGQHQQDKGKVQSRVDTSDAEMQDVAESASFVGNGQRRNGYTYDTVHGGQKLHDDRKGYDRSKLDRGRQKYRDDTSKSSRGHNQKVGEDADEYSGKDGKDGRYFSRDRGATPSSRDRQNKKLESETQTTPGLLHQQRHEQTKDRQNTTPRRLDNSRTTPYYTPTVPTIRVPGGGKPESLQDSSATTLSPNQLLGSSRQGGLDAGKEPGDSDRIGGSFTKPGRGNGQAASFNTNLNGITNSFAVSGPPAITLAPQDYSSGKDSNIQSQSPNFGTTSSHGTPQRNPSGIKEDSSPHRINNGAGQATKPSNRGGEGSDDGYSYKTPSTPDAKVTTQGSGNLVGTPDKDVLIGGPTGQTGIKTPSNSQDFTSKVPLETFDSKKDGSGYTYQAPTGGSSGKPATFEPKKDDSGYSHQTPTAGSSGKPATYEPKKDGSGYSYQTPTGGSAGKPATFEPKKDGSGYSYQTPTGGSTGKPATFEPKKDGSGYSYQTPTGESSGKPAISGNHLGHSQISPGISQSDSAFESSKTSPEIGHNGSPFNTIQGATAGSLQESILPTTTLSSLNDLNQATLSPTEIPSILSQQGVPSNSDRANILPSQVSSATPTPIVIGMRGNLPTDTAHILGGSSPIIKVNILSDSTYSTGKSSVTSPGNSIPNAISQDSSHKPTTFKPFSLSASGQTNLPKDGTTIRPSSAGPTYLPRETTTYSPPSGGPTYLPKSTLSPPSDSVSEHVQEMITTLSGLRGDLGDDKDNKATGKTRAGLDIPPSSGPETLHSLALYFAAEGDNSSTTGEKGESPATVRADITAVPLSNKTVQQYEALFGLSTTEKGIEPTLPPSFQPNVARSGNDLEAQTSNNLLGDTGGKTETRKIAQVFTNALSAYLEDPDSFRKVLTEVRPTEPPSTEENEVTTQPRTTSQFFNRGTAASYLPTVPTTVSPSTTTDDLEVLDFSDVTISTGQRSQSAFGDSTTTDIPTTSRPGLQILDRVPASSLNAAKGTKQGKKLRIDGESATDSNQIAVEINKGLGLSTVVPYFSDNNGKTGKSKSSFEVDLSTTGSPDSATTTNLPITFDLLPPIGSKGKEFGPPSSDILPPGFDDDEDTLQRAQSQSFVSSRNRLGKDDSDKINTKLPGHYITRLISDLRTTTEHPNPWFLDPLTINDGLMDEFKTTTASPYTYLPKVTSTTTETSPVHLDLSSGVNRIHLDEKKFDRIGKALPGIPEDLLPPSNGMQRIANKVFGGLNESSADHLMNVMRKAEDNPTVRRLILLLIQTCGDDDYSKTVEQSRQALLNALIGMDESFAVEDEIEVIKLRPKQNRRGKSIAASDQNVVVSSTTQYPITTFRRKIDVNSYTTTTVSPSTTDFSASTTQNPFEETTRFEIRVEDPEEITSTSSASSELDINLSTTTKYSSSQETTSNYNAAEASGLTTISPVASASSIKGASRRRAKHLDNSLSQPSNFSHKSSDERALELLKSLYSLASKFGRR